MKKTKAREPLITLITIVVIGTLLLAGLARSETISAVVPWQGEGQIFPIDLDKARFLGSVQGIMYVESEDGTMNEAFVRCPIVQDIDTSNGQTSASGNCVIAVGPDETVFAAISCEGTRGYCRGTFTITGGTGTFTGITGSGKMTARSPVHALAGNLSEGMLVDRAIGILQLPALKIRRP